MYIYFNSVITATGSYIPQREVPNSSFLDQKFYTKDGKPEMKESNIILKKFEERTGIKSRRYSSDNQVASDLGAIALMNTGVDVHSLDMIIGASNYGDVRDIRHGMFHTSDFVPSVASRVARKAGYIEKSGDFKAYDIINGCPGFLEGVIDADLRIKNRLAEKVAIVGMETLSKVRDDYDKDSLIYSDGAGAVILERVVSNMKEGILSYTTKTIRYFDPKRSDVTDCSEYLKMEGNPNNPLVEGDRLYLKMMGPNVAQLAIKHVPIIIKETLSKAKVNAEDVKMFLLHQANEKLDMDMALASGVKKEDLATKVPITLDFLGNSSVATIPTLMDLVFRNKLKNGDGHVFNLDPGDLVLMASVGAGMDINAVAYKMPLTY